MIATLIVPEFDNDGKELAAEVASLRTQAAAEFGGLTVIKGAEGLWLDAGTLYADKIQVWRIAYTEATGTEEFAARVEALAQDVKTICRQQAVYLEFQSAYVRFI